MGPQTRDLDGWKNIAAYLKVTPRAAQRWRRERGLPIHRMAGRIYASREELDEWARRNDSAFLEADPDTEGADGQTNGLNGETLDEGANHPPDVSGFQTDSAPPRRRRFAGRSWFVAAGFLALVLVAAAVRQWDVWDRLGVPTAPAFTVDRLFAKAAAEGGELRSVKLGGRPIRVIVHPSRPEIYVLGAGSGEVTAVDADHLSALWAVRAGWQPSGMVLDPKGRALYVATHGDGLVRIDVETRRQSVFHDGLAGGPLLALAMSADGRRLYLAMGHGGLRVMDLPAGNVRTVSAIACPYSLAIAPGGRYLYVGYQCGGPRGFRGHDSIEMFDLSTEQPVRTLGGVPLVAGPLAATPGDLTLWANGSDACTQFYADGDQSSCPVKPGWVFHVFRPQDGMRLATFGSAMEDVLTRAVALPGGKVIVLGSESRVFEAGSAKEVERFRPAETGYWVDAALDPLRRRFIAVDETRNAMDVVSLPSASCSPAPSGLWGHWPLDGNYQDRRGGPSLSPAGEPGFAPGLVGSAADLSRGSLAVTTTSEPHTAFFTSAPGTLAFWLKPVGGNGVIARYRAESRVFDWQLSRTAGGSLRLELAGGQVLESRPVPSGSWTQVALVRTPAQVELVVNGSVDASAPSTVAKALDSFTSQRLLQFGPFDGLIDEIVSYDRWLTPEDLRSLDHTIRDCVTSPD